MDNQEYNKSEALEEALSITKSGNIIEKDSSKIKEIDVGLILKNVSEKKSIKNFLLDENDGFLDPDEIIYPSNMNKEFTGSYSNNLANKEAEFKNKVQPFFMPKSQDSKPFIVANTVDVELEHLKQDCIIPVFSKDNEKTIAHQEFIDVV